MSIHIRVATRFMEAAGMSFPRESYLPKNVRDTEPVNPEGTDLAIWKYEAGGKFYAIAFAGKANKPLWNYSFRSEAKRDEYINETIDSRKQKLKQKQDVQQERREWQHDLKVGGILYSSWGYDQTNVDFYEVTAVAGKAIAIRPIESRNVGSGGQGENKVIAVPGKFTGPAMKKIPSKGYAGGSSVRLNSYSSAYPWDGKPMYETDAYSGH